MSAVHRLTAGYSLLFAFLLAAQLLATGCVYEPQVLPEQDLLLLLPHSQASINSFSFDLGSSLMIPYLSGFGKYHYSGNTVSASSNVVITFPLTPIIPSAIVIQSSLEDSGSESSYIRVSVNDEDIGYMQVKKEPFRKLLKLKSGLWDSSVSTMKIEMPRSGQTAAVDNIWLLTDQATDISQLAPGNNFVGFVAYLDSESWGEALFLPGRASVSVPVQLPGNKAVFDGEALADQGGDLSLDLELITARAFLPEKSLQSKVMFRDADQWLPVGWDISERRGRNALLKISNSGDSAVLIRHPVVHS
jgi:hypothetical protein